MINYNREAMRKAIRKIVPNFDDPVSVRDTETLLDTIESQLGAGKECMCIQEPKVHWDDCPLYEKEDVPLPGLPMELPFEWDDAAQAKNIYNQVQQIIRYLSAKANQDK